MSYGIEIKYPNLQSVTKMEFDILADYAICLMSLDATYLRPAVPAFRYEPAGNRGLDKFSLTCDGCHEPIRGPIFQTAKLSRSNFCSLDCRDAAEFAAESVR